MDLMRVLVDASTSVAKTFTTSGLATTDVATRDAGVHVSIASAAGNLVKRANEQNSIEHHRSVSLISYFIDLSRGANRLVAVGSTLSLKYLRSDWVAPLGSTSLVFNFIFAKILVGIEVTKEDVRGTALIVLGVLCILIFSSINHGLDAVITVER